jgi:hypothetical protein
MARSFTDEGAFFISGLFADGFRLGVFFIVEEDYNLVPASGANLLRTAKTQRNLV